MQFLDEILGQLLKLIEILYFSTCILLLIYPMLNYFVVILYRIVNSFL